MFSIYATLLWNIKTHGHCDLNQLLWVGKPGDTDEIAGRAVSTVVLAVKRLEKRFSADAVHNKDIFGHDLVACGAHGSQTLDQIIVSRVHLRFKVSLGDHATAFVKLQLAGDVNGLAHLQHLGECFLRGGQSMSESFDFR